MFYIITNQQKYSITNPAMNVMVCNSDRLYIQNIKCKILTQCFLIIDESKQPYKTKNKRWIQKVHHFMVDLQITSIWVSHTQICQITITKHNCKNLPQQNLSFYIKYKSLTVLLQRSVKNWICCNVIRNTVIMVHGTSSPSYKTDKMSMQSVKESAR